MFVFPFPPDARGDIVETLTWQTDVLRSTSGAEQRRALRLAPRRSFAFGVTVAAAKRTLFDLTIQAAGGAEFALPIWPDGQSLQAPLAAAAGAVPCSTAGRDFVPGGHAVLTGCAAMGGELLQVAGVTADGLGLAAPTTQSWPAGTRLYPVRRAILQGQPTVTRKLPGLAWVDVALEIVEPCNWPTVMPAETYLGRPVLDRPLLIAQDLTQSYERLLHRLDNETGIPRITDSAGMGFAVRQCAWVARDRADLSALRSLLYALRGQQKAVWLPTKTDDLTPLAIAGANLTVQPCGYSAFGLLQNGRQHIRVQLHSGSALCRRIVSAGSSPAGEVLTLNAPLGVSVSQIRRICFLTLSRQAADAIELNYTPMPRDSLLVKASSTFRGVKESVEL